MTGVVYRSRLLAETEDREVNRAIRNVGHSGCCALCFMIVSVDKKWYNQRNVVLI